jgi:hypothetical protein
MTDGDIDEDVFDRPIDPDDYEIIFLVKKGAISGDSVGKAGIALGTGLDVVTTASIVAAWLDAYAAEHGLRPPPGSMFGGEPPHLNEVNPFGAPKRKGL